MEACWPKQVIPKGYLKIFRDPPAGKDNASGGSGSGLAFGAPLPAGDSIDTSSNPPFLLELTGAQVTLPIIYVGLV